MTGKSKSMYAEAIMTYIRVLTHHTDKH